MRAVYLLVLAGCRNSDRVSGPIEAEVLDSLTLPEGRPLGYAEARRNIVTHGIDLNALVGQPPAIVSPKPQATRTVDTPPQDASIPPQ